MRLITKAVAAAVLTGCSLLASRAPGAETADLALAERFAALADRYGSSPAAAPYRQSLFDAAGRLATSEVRFRRDRLRAAETSGDVESALATLLEWRKLEPQNLFVQQRLVDVYAGRLQTADAKIAYLKQVADADSVDPQVRSHATTNLARLYLEQSRTQLAMETLRKALLLNGLNIDAMNLQWQTGLGGSTPLQRISLLLNILKADPASTEAVIKIADDLARLGMVQQSLQWYGHASNMSRPLGGLVTIAPQAAKDYASELLVAGQDRGAAEITSKLLEKDINDPGAWYLTVLAERNMKDRIEQVRKNALIGLLNHLAVARQAIGVKEATTRPLGSEELVMPNLTGDAELLKKAAPQKLAAYTSSLADVGWFLAWQGANAMDAMPYVKAIQASAPQDTLTATRIEGWVLLRTGKLEEARTKLAPIAEKEPLAALGMVRILRQDPASAREATDLARQLKVEFPSGTLGAIVQSEVGDFLTEVPADSLVEPVKDLLDRFPREILKQATAPQDFLTLRLQPQQVGHDFAEPILLDVDLRNAGQLPLVIGPSGMARDVWIDVQTRGLNNQWISGVTWDQLDGPVLLQPDSSTRYTIRLDQGQLGEWLDRNPVQAIQMSVFALTNAVPTEQEIGPGPCGIRGRMAQMIERRAANLAAEGAMRKARSVVDGTDAVAKLRLADQVAAHLRISLDPAGAPEIKALDAELRDLLIRLSQDSSPSVRAWSLYRMAQTNVEPAERAVMDLSGDPTWYVRLLAAAATAQTPDSARDKLLGPLAKDSDPTVRSLAKSLPAAIAAKAAASTNPTTSPKR